MKISTCHTSQERLLGLELSHFFFFLLEVQATYLLDHLFASKTWQA